MMGRARGRAPSTDSGSSRLGNALQERRNGFDLLSADLSPCRVSPSPKSRFGSRRLRSTRPVATSTSRTVDAPFMPEAAGEGIGCSGGAGQRAAAASSLPASRLLLPLLQSHRREARRAVACLLSMPMSMLPLPLPLCWWPPPRLLRPLPAPSPPPAPHPSTPRRRLCNSWARRRSGGRTAGPA